MAYSAWSVVFGEQPSAAKWNILGTNDAYFDSLVGSGTAWASWTPTLSGRLDDADWTKDAKFQQIGKTVFGRMKLTATAAAPMGGGTSGAIFTLPVTAVDYGTSDLYYGIGVGGLYDSGTAVYAAEVLFRTTTTAQIRSYTIPSVHVTLDPLASTSPFTWTTNDQITCSFTYEAA